MKNNKLWFGERMFFPGIVMPITWQGLVVAVLMIVIFLAGVKIAMTSLVVGIIIIIAGLTGYTVIARVKSGRTWSWGMFRKSK